ncbi:MAG: autotransporter-associated beta strand repeat-containing protein, partial [Thermoguttaceae bacterium]
DNSFGNFILNSGVTAGGTAMSTVDARSVSLRDTGGVFNVADVTAGSDLRIQSNIVNHPGFDAVLTKTGAGTLELTGANTYTGATNVAGGALTLSDGGRLGGGTYNAPISLGAGAVLNFNMTNNQNLEGALTGTGTLAQNTAADFLYMSGDQSAFVGTFHNMAGSMFLASSAANSPAGARARIDGGVLQIAPNGSGDGTWRIGALSGTGGAVQPNRNLAGRAITLEVGGLNTDTSYSGALRNNSNGTPSVLALAKVGIGTLTLAATNTYTGGTTVEDGVLEVAATRALGSGPITINGGTVRLATTTYNALGTPSPAIVLGPGATLTAAQGGGNAHNLGPLTLNGGTLTTLNGPAGPATRRTAAAGRPSATAGRAGTS